MSLSIDATPPTGSAPFRQFVARLDEHLETYELVALVLYGIDQKKLTQVLEKIGQSTSSASDKRQLAVEAVRGAQQSEANLHALVKVFDSSAKHERSLIKALLNEQLQRLPQLPALLFRRQGSRLIWATLRDSRTSAHEHIPKMLELFKQRIDVQADFLHTADSLAAHQLLEKVEKYYSTISSSVMQVEQQRFLLENERAQLIVKLGTHTNTITALKNELELVRQENHQLQASLKTFETLQGQSESAVPTLERDEVAQVAEQLSRLKKEMLTTTRKRDIVYKLIRKEIMALNDPQRDFISHVRYSAPREAAKQPVNNTISSGNRVAVFLDVANIAGAARTLYGSNVDYGSLIRQAAEQRLCTVARAYAIDKAAGFDAFRFALEKIGFTVCSKSPQRHQDGSIKADWDVSIVVDALEHSGQFDICVVISGDGDLVPMLEALQKRNKKVEVMAFQAHTSGSLMTKADAFIALDERNLLKSMDLQPA